MREYGTRESFYIVDINYFPGRFEASTPLRKKTPKKRGKEQK